MRIMLVNDDGYRAEGIRTLARRLIKDGHKVTICAPEHERSGASHSFSFGRYLPVKAFDEDGLSGYAIDGSPADSAALGLYLMENAVDLVISGINNGTNLGGACVYSGTVGAAMEASMLGCPAIAASIGDYNDGYRFEDAAEVISGMLEWVMTNPRKRGEVYNINVPNLPRSEIKGFRRATLTYELKCNSSYQKLETEDGRTGYMTRFGGFSDSGEMNCDHMLLKHGWVTITPVTWNMEAESDFALPEDF